LRARARQSKPEVRVWARQWPAESPVAPKKAIVDMAVVGLG